MKEIIFKGLRVVIDEEDYPLFTMFNWYIKTTPSNKKYLVSYSQKVVNGKVLYNKKFSLHRVITNAPSDKEIDHINQNTLDNRKCNLRICDKSDNLKNKSKYKNNTTGYKGVTKKNGRRKKYMTQISIDGKTKFIGSFLTAKEAAEKYDEVCLIHYGEFGSLNFK